MPRYQANASILNLKAGDTFESGDPFYGPFVKGGYLTVLDTPEEAEEPPAVEPASVDLSTLDRKGLVAFAEEQGLDIRIPNNTPLTDEQVRVAAALAEASE